MTTLVLQSSRQPAPTWMASCMNSVRQWADSQGHDYRFIDDAIFASVPDWYLHKVGDRKQIATDYARLVLLKQALDSEGYEEAIWFDADVLILDQALTLGFEGSCAFGQEVWVQEKARSSGKAILQKDGNCEPESIRLQVHRNVHNAVCVFRRGCVVLPFLLHCIESLMQRVDEQHLVPQFVGPKLLKVLHPLADFSVLPQVGALSPLVVDDVLGGGGRALELMVERSARPLQAANLCASLIDDDRANLLVQQLSRGVPR